MADFMGVIGNISTLIGLGRQLKDIFGGPTPLTISDIRTAVREEVTAALRSQAFDDELVSASATLQSVQSFISTDYLNAIKHGTNPFDPSSLSGRKIGPILTEIEHDLDAVRSFMEANDIKTAAKGIPVSLGLHLYKSIVYREFAKFGDAQTSLADVQSYAQAGIQDIAPRLAKLVETLLNSLDHLSNDNPDIWGVQYCTIDSLHDTWIDTWLFAFKMKDDDTMDYADALDWVRRATRNLLWSGTQADADEFTRSLTDGWLRLPGRVPLSMPGVPIINLPAFADNFRNTCLDANTKFGKLVQGARTTLLGLDALASGYSGAEQDSWSWCSSCGGLHFVGTASRCPASKGPHSRAGSGNYVVRGDPTEPTSGPMSRNWRWCRKCSGMFKDQGPRLCPAGGTHDPTGSGLYELDVAPISDTNARGLPDAQDNWRSCGKCSALHFGAGSSVCPAGGSHDSGDGENLWLRSLGWMPPQ